jgi:biopolymer transport protein ExbD
MNFQTRDHAEPEINLISLVDVVLLLVIFFMVSSTFVDEGRLKVQLPEAGAEQVDAAISDPIVVTVTERGAYRVNGRDLVNNSFDTLRAAVVKVAGENRAAAVTIRADAQATHQSVVTAMDVIGRLGFRQVNIATLHEDAQQ